MNRTYKHLVSSFFGFWLLVSCTAQNAAVMTAVPSPEVKATITAIPATAGPTATLPAPEPTGTETSKPAAPDATPTLKTIYNNPEQVTDGKLKLSIGTPAGKCYKPGDRVPIILAYENLTTKPLTIVDYNAIDTHVLFGTEGQLFPILNTTAGEQIFTPYDFMMVEVFNPNSPLLHELPGQSVLDVPVEYYLSPKILEREQAIPTPPGQYLLKFVYMSIPRDRSVWDGSISSNQIEICIGE